MTIYWRGASSISAIQKIPLSEANRIWEKARYEAHNLKTTFCGLAIALALTILGYSLTFFNLGIANMTGLLQQIIFLCALVIVVQMKFFVTNYKVNQYFDSLKNKQF